MEETHVYESDIDDWACWSCDNSKFELVKANWFSHYHKPAMARAHFFFTSKATKSTMISSHLWHRPFLLGLPFLRARSHIIWRLQNQWGAFVHLVLVDIGRYLQIAMLHHLPGHDAIILVFPCLDKPIRAEKPCLLHKVALEGIDHIDLVLWQMAWLDASLALCNLVHLHELQAAQWQQDQISFGHLGTCKDFSLVGAQDWRITQPWLQNQKFTTATYGKTNESALQTRNSLNFSNNWNWAWAFPISSSKDVEAQGIRASLTTSGMRWGTGLLHSLRPFHSLCTTMISSGSSKNGWWSSLAPSSVNSTSFHTFPGCFFIMKWPSSLMCLFVAKAIAWASEASSNVLTTSEGAEVVAAGVGWAEPCVAACTRSSWNCSWMLAMLWNCFFSPLLSLLSKRSTSLTCSFPKTKAVFSAARPDFSTVCQATLISCSAFSHSGSTFFCLSRSKSDLVILLENPSLMHSFGDVTWAATKATRKKGSVVVLSLKLEYAKRLQNSSPRKTLAPYDRPQIYIKHKLVSHGPSWWACTGCLGFGKFCQWAYIGWKTWNGFWYSDMSLQWLNLAWYDCKPSYQSHPGIWAAWSPLLQRSCPQSHQCIWCSPCKVGC